MTDVTEQPIFREPSTNEFRKTFKKIILEPVETRGKPGKLTEISLSKICLENGIEFEPTNHFYVTDLDSTESRGNHSNSNASEVLICLRGSFDIKLHDGKSEVVVSLKQHEGIYVDRDIWLSYYNFRDCVVLAFVSVGHSEKESCCEFSDFLKKSS